MARARGWHARIEKCKQLFSRAWISDNCARPTPSAKPTPRCPARGADIYAFGHNRDVRALDHDIGPAMYIYIYIYICMYREMCSYTYIYIYAYIYIEREREIITCHVMLQHIMLQRVVLHCTKLCALGYGLYHLYTRQSIALLHITLVFSPGYSHINTYTYIYIYIHTHNIHRIHMHLITLIFQLC